METIVFFLVSCWVLPGGYIWRDHISRARHDRARMEQRRERRQMMGIFDPSVDGTYRPLGWPKE